MSPSSNAICLRSCFQVQSMNPQKPGLEASGPDLKETHVVFVRSKKGEYSARIDDVRVVLGNGSFEVVTDGDRYFVGGLSSYEETETMVRDIFNNQWKYQDRNDPYARPWPESVANRFGKQPWILDPPPLSSAK